LPQKKPLQKKKVAKLPKEVEEITDRYAKESLSAKYGSASPKTEKEIEEMLPSSTARLRAVLKKRALAKYGM